MIAPGNTLAGSTLSQAYACTESLDNAGQVPFLADLTDGRTLVVRAEPLL